MSGTDCTDINHCECVDGLYERIAELETENRELRLAYRTVRAWLANIGRSMYECTGSVERTLNAFPIDPTKPEETEMSD